MSIKKNNCKYHVRMYTYIYVTSNYVHTYVTTRVYIYLCMYICTFLCFTDSKPTIPLSSTEIKPSKMYVFLFTYPYVRIMDM